MTLFCLFGCEARSNWSELIPPPKKPGNYKEETWQKKLPEELAKLGTTAPHHFLGGKVTSVLMCTDESAVAEYTPTGFMELLVNELTNGQPVKIVTIHATDRFRQLLWTVSGEESFQFRKILPICWAASSENRGDEYRRKLVDGTISGSLSILDLESMTGAKGKSITWREWAQAWSVKAESPASTAHDGGWGPHHTLEVLRGLAYRVGIS